MARPCKPAISYCQQELPSSSTGSTEHIPFTIPSLPKKGEREKKSLQKPKSRAWKKPHRIGAYLEKRKYWFDDLDCWLLPI